MPEFEDITEGLKELFEDAQCENIQDVMERNGFENVKVGYCDNFNNIFNF